MCIVPTLYSRRQFPSPVVQSSPFPSIPVWQRNDTQPTDNDSGIVNKYVKKNSS